MSPQLAIAAPQRSAAEAGAAAFAAGGNALDAALAAAASLTVTYPDNCALGGDLIALVGLPDGTFTVVNASARRRRPSTSTRSAPPGRRCRCTAQRR